MSDIYSHFAIRHCKTLSLPVSITHNLRFVFDDNRTHNRTQFIPTLLGSKDDRVHRRPCKS